MAITYHAGSAVFALQRHRSLRPTFPGLRRVMGEDGTDSRVLRMIRLLLLLSCIDTFRRFALRSTRGEGEDGGLVDSGSSSLVMLRDIDMERIDLKLHSFWLACAVVAFAAPTFSFTLRFTRCHMLGIPFLLQHVITTVLQWSFETSTDL